MKKINQSIFSSWHNMPDSISDIIDILKQCKKDKVTDVEIRGGFSTQGRCFRYESNFLKIKTDKFISLLTILEKTIGNQDFIMDGEIFCNIDGQKKVIKK